MNKFDVSENMLFWAFRYAIGRRTGAVMSVVKNLKNNWDKLKPSTQDQIQREINIAINQCRAGDNCDVEEWRKLL